ncbi:hypothetical protein RRG08_012219 [Elysia crispata]|uniref:Uncharacterized protein n=1 Tax=Elysia crispata TaxID=231223 RepID=A0AAE1DB70_9GAST|nr:hypothetical protein RRG08_012219 [Elysia crispata]
MSLVPAHPSTQQRPSPIGIETPSQTVMSPFLPGAIAWITWKTSSVWPGQVVPARVVPGCVAPRDSQHQASCSRHSTVRLGWLQMAKNSSSHCGTGRF